MATVPFFDAHVPDGSVRRECWSKIQQIIASGQFALGPEVQRFEEAFAAFLGVEHCVGVGSGTDALVLSLVAAGIGPGDEVITTPLTWFATSSAITRCGATPIWVDVDAATFGLDAEKVRSAICHKTKAIIAVHLYGCPCQIAELRRIATENCLLLIEDAAQAHGATYDGRRLGSFGNIGCFSFYPSKNLGAYGEAGCVVTEDCDIADAVRRLRDHGQAGRHVHVSIGYNSRMDAIQAAVLLAKLPHLDEWNAMRAACAREYTLSLRDVKGVQTPHQPEHGDHVWHLYVVLADNRDRLMAHLGRNGVQCQIHYPTLIPLQPAYQGCGATEVDYPVAFDVTQRCLSLPLFPHLSKDQIAVVTQVVKNAIVSKGTHG